MKTILDLLEEVREDSTVKATVRQRQVTQYYNKWVKFKNFENEDLVLKNYWASRRAKEIISYLGRPLSSINYNREWSLHVANLRRIRDPEYVECSALKKIFLLKPSTYHNV